jgi:hypothetical protein
MSSLPHLLQSGKKRTPDGVAAQLNSAPSRAVLLGPQILIKGGFWESLGFSGQRRWAAALLIRLFGGGEGWG